MCIRDRHNAIFGQGAIGLFKPCLLYTSDAADELDGVDLGGRRIIKKE
ncbi:hypothetical protein JMUB7543_28530 [Staphylococcus aureus]